MSIKGYRNKNRFLTFEYIRKHYGVEYYYIDKLILYLPVNEKKNYCRVDRIIILLILCLKRKNILLTKSSLYVIINILCQRVLEFTNPATYFKSSFGQYHDNMKYREWFFSLETNILTPNYSTRFIEILNIFKDYFLTKEGLLDRCLYHCSGYTNYNLMIWFDIFGNKISLPPVENIFYYYTESTSKKVAKSRQIWENAMNFIFANYDHQTIADWISKFARRTPTYRFHDDFRKKILVILNDRLDKLK